MATGPGDTKSPDQQKTMAKKAKNKTRDGREKTTLISTRLPRTASRQREEERYQIQQQDPVIEALRTIQAKSRITLPTVSQRGRNFIKVHQPGEGRLPRKTAQVASPFRAYIRAKPEPKRTLLDKLKFLRPGYTYT